MNNSNSMLGSLLTAGKNQAFSGHSSAQDSIKRDHRISTPSAREAEKSSALQKPSTRDGTRAGSENESADFRATMDKIAKAKSQAKREDVERAASKRSDQQIAERKLQQQSLAQDRSAASLAKDRSAASLNDHDHRQTSVDGASGSVNETPEAELKTSDTDRPMGETVSHGSESLSDSPPADSGELVLLTEAVDPSLMGEETNVAAAFAGDSLIPVPDAGAELAVQGLPASPLEPAAGLSSIISEKTAGSGAAVTQLADATQSANNSGLKPANLQTELTADALTTEKSVTKEAGNKLPLDGDAAITDSKTNFEKLLATAQGESRIPSQELTPQKGTVSGLPTLDGTVRSAEPPLPATRGFVVQTGVPVTMGQPRWGEAVGERVLWLAAQNVSSAELRLDPPELGPMQVRITINQDQASISFSSPHLGVREALDQSAMRLRDMFQEQGLNLLNLDVSDQPLARHQTGDNSSGRNSDHTDGDAGEEEPVVGVSTKLSSVRLIDHYA